VIHLFEIKTADSAHKGFFQVSAGPFLCSSHVGLGTRLVLRARLCQPPLPEAVWMPGWQRSGKELFPYSQSPQACKSVCRVPIWLTTALMEWNALHTIKPADLVSVMYAGSHTFPAMQCTTATFLSSSFRNMSMSSQNGLMSSKGGALWSPNGYVAIVKGEGRGGG